MDRMCELEYLSLQCNLFFNNRQRFSSAVAHTSPQWHRQRVRLGTPKVQCVPQYTLSGETTEAVLLMACTPSAQRYMDHSLREMASLFLFACTP